MAGCCIVMLALIGIPLLLIALVIFLGLLGGSIVGLLTSVISLVVLTKTGVFKKYCNSDVFWQKILAYIGMVLLIILLIGSIILLTAGIYLMIMLGS